MKAILVRSDVAKACASFVSHDEGRYALAGVQVRADADGMATWEATDGKSLLSIKVAAPDGYGKMDWQDAAPNGGERAILEAKALAKAAEAFGVKGGRRSEPISALGIIAEAVEAPKGGAGADSPAFLTVGGADGSVKVNGIEGSFPNCEAVFGSVKDSTFQIQVDARRLGEALLALAKLSDGEGCRNSVTMSFRDKLSAIVIEARCPNARLSAKALVMPLTWVE